MYVCMMYYCMLENARTKKSALEGTVKHGPDFLQKFWR